MIKKKHLTTAANCSTTQPNGLLQFRDALMKGVSKTTEEDVMKSVFVNDLQARYDPDAFAEGLLEDTTPEWMPDRLRSQMKDALRGLDEDMALEVADDLLDCWTYGVRHYIGIRHIDEMLHSLYNKIIYCASQQGIELPMHF